MDNSLRQLSHEQQEIKYKLRTLEKQISKILLSQSTILQTLTNSSYNSIIATSSTPTSPHTTSQSHSPTTLDAPSSQIFDDLLLLNETGLDPLIENFKLSRYQTNFVFISALKDITSSHIIHPKNIPKLNDSLLLPFLFTDSPVETQNVLKSSITVIDHEWIDSIHAYRITDDGTVRRITNVIIRKNEFNNYYTEYNESPLSINSNDFINICVARKITLLGVSLNYSAIKFLRNFLVINNLLSRSLLYLKARDYIVAQQGHINHEIAIDNINKSLRNVIDQSISTGVFKIRESSTLQYNVQSCFITIADPGDDLETLLGDPFLRKGLTAYQFSTQRISYLLPDRLNYLLLNEYQEYLIRVTQNGFEQKVKCKAIAILGIEVNLSASKKMLTRVNQRSSSIDDGVKYISLFSLQTKEYKGNIPVIRIDVPNGTIQYTADYIRFDDGRWKFGVPRKDIPQELFIYTMGYTFPPKFVRHYIDVLIFNSRILPYSMLQRGKYNITYTLDERVMSDGTIIDVPEKFTSSIDMEVITVELGAGIEAVALRGRVEIDSNTERLYGFRAQLYKFKDAVRTTLDDKFIDNAAASTNSSSSWIFKTMDGEPYDYTVAARFSIIFLEAIHVPLLQVPMGFKSSTLKYDLEFKEMHELIVSLVFRTSNLQIDVGVLKHSLKDLQTFTLHLSESVTQLGKAFVQLTKELEDGGKTPWWKKALLTVASVAGIAASIAFPFCLPLAIGLIVGSTAIQVGFLLAEGDYLTGGLQMAGCLIGLGIGYYSIRSAAQSDFPVLNLKKAGFIEPEYPPEFNQKLLLENGLKIEVKPLEVLGSGIKGLGQELIRKQNGVLRILHKMENAPVHARVRVVSTQMVENNVVRDTLISGVTDGMPYLSHINPRPGTIALKEVYVNDHFEPGWSALNVPIGGEFRDMDLSIQGLLLEGTGTTEEFHTLMRSWGNLDASERAITLNDAQQYFTKTQPSYTDLPGSHVPIAFDHTLVTKIANVFAKHTGIYELTGITRPSGPNNCQTYANELRGFLAKGALRESKLQNTVFLNELMDAFDQSTQFSHIYGPGLLKRERP